MVQADSQTGGNIVSQNIAAANTVTVTLLAPSTGMANKIKSISCYATAATAADVHVTKNDGTSIARIGGVGTGILNQPLYFGESDDPRGGITGYSGDATKVVLTTAAGTNTECSVVYEQVPA